jgi:hypothetical protein
MVEIVQVHAVLAQGGQQFLVPELVLVGDELEHILPDGVEDLPRRHLVGARIVRFVLDLLFDAGHPHLEKFVEVRGHDAEEAHPLQQRLRRVLRLLQHAPVERQPAQLAIDEKLRPGKVRRGGIGRHGLLRGYPHRAAPGNARKVTFRWRAVRVGSPLGCPG